MRYHAPEKIGSPTMPCATAVAYGLNVPTELPTKAPHMTIAMPVMLS